MLTAPASAVSSSTTSSAAKRRVDEVIDEAKKAGGKILKPAAKLQWGGYGGTFADPDGYIWSDRLQRGGKGSALRRVVRNR